MKKLLCVLMLLFSLFVGMASAAYPDIVGYLLTQPPINTWTAEKKQALLDRFCEATRYNSASGLTKREHVNMKIAEFIQDTFSLAARQEAINKVTYETITLTNP